MSPALERPHESEKHRHPLQTRRGRGGQGGGEEGGAWGAGGGVGRG